MTLFRIAFLMLWMLSSVAMAEEETPAAFSQFSMLLPPHWDGEEQTGFISDNPEEYALTLGRKDARGDNFIAQVSIYLLPNKPGADSPTAAKILAEAQGEASIPVQNGNFWEFTGEPRSRTIKGTALTKVKATEDTLLIIIAQDPENLGSEQILASLKGETPKARQMLGQ